ncbi:hypothetical protein LCGC14_2817430 [marine sediment metagenome]|uniref:4Fe-4S domain-containing protein n=1 Tax=marine sediment metagenome TaxID=412755 RepID=A0A0F9ARG5_9ZZZZ
MSYASALIRQEKALEDCPHLSKEARQELAPLLEASAPEEGFREMINALKAEVRGFDLSAMAQGLGAEYSEGRLHIKCLGKDFIIRDNGNLESICHVNVWVELMLLNYCRMQGRGSTSGRWVSYGDLPSASPTAPYFEKRFEEPLRAIADSHQEVFLDLMEVFGGQQVEGFDADHAFIIHPLPKVPFLVLYTEAEDDFPSSLRVLLDSSVTTYIPKEAITYTGRGIVEMFKRIISKHQDGVSQKLMSM